ncbi:MAG: hypothetical protein KGJ13_09735 [Patescibacteria group bacterium]|nr:hypothetical protein [Patescibacteria group bacterium]
MDKARRSLDRERAKQIAALDKQRAKIDREYRRKLRQLEKIGAYEPARTKREKRTKTLKLTKARKAAINRQYKKFEEIITGDVYVFVPFPTKSKKKREEIARKAKRNKYRATKKGIAVHKGTGVSSAKMVKNRRGEYVIRVRRKRKGRTGSRKTTEIVPIEPFRTVDDEIDRIAADAELLGSLGKGESYRFRVELYADGEGFSRAIFGDVAALRRYLSDRYDFEQYPEFGMEFFQSITVMKVSASQALEQNAARNEYKRKRYNERRRTRRARKEGRSVMRPGRF